MNVQQPPQKVLYRPGQALMHRKENIFSPYKFYKLENNSRSFQTDINDFEKDMRILIEHNQRLKDQINIQSQEVKQNIISIYQFENMRMYQDKLQQDSLRLISELEQLQDSFNLQNKDLRVKIEQIKELQAFIESKNNSDNRQSEELAQTKLQMAHKDQEIIDLKGIIDAQRVEIQELKNTLATINDKVKFITTQKDQQYNILEQFNKELQADIQGKTAQIHSLSQTISGMQNQLSQINLEYDTSKRKVMSQQQMISLTQLQGKYLILCAENERMHQIVIEETNKSKELTFTIYNKDQEIDRVKNELQRVIEEFGKLQQGLAYEQRNHYIIEDLKRQVNNYVEENARLNMMIYGKQ